MGNPSQTSVSFLERPTDPWPAGAPASRPPSPAGRDRAPVDTDLSTLGTVLLATVSIFEGYKWLDAIPTSHSHLSRAVFSQPGAAAIAVCSLLAVAFLSGTSRLHSRVAPRRALWAAAVVVSTLALVVATFDTDRTRSALGAADLVLAGVAISTLVPIGRRTLRTGRAGVAVAPGGPGGRGSQPTRPPQHTSLSFRPFP